jgi:uncharacterized protein (TIGR02996 family)
MSPEQGFQADISERPGDDTPRLVYADWLEEQGRPDEAFCQRWMAKHGKYPGDRCGLRVTGSDESPGRVSGRPDGK